MEYDRFAVSVSADYETFTSSLTALYLRLRLTGRDIGNASTVQMQVDAHQLLNSFLHRANALTQTYIAGVTNGKSADLRNSESSLIFSRALRVIAHNNSAAIVRKAIGSSDLAGIMTDRGGAMAQLARIATDVITYTSRDAAGRTLNSAVLVKTMARNFAYQTHIDQALKVMQDEGIALAQVAYLDSSHKNHGLVVSLTGAPVGEHPTFESVRATIFHYNATASLVHVQS